MVRVRPNYCLLLCLVFASSCLQDCEETDAPEVSIEAPSSVTACVGEIAQVEAVVHVVRFGIEYPTGAVWGTGGDGVETGPRATLAVDRDGKDPRMLTRGDNLVRIPFVCSSPGESTLEAGVSISNKEWYDTDQVEVTVTCEDCSEDCVSHLLLSGIPGQGTESPAGNTTVGSDGTSTVVSSGETDTVCQHAATVAPENVPVGLGNCDGSVCGPQAKADEVQLLTGEQLFMAVQLDGPIPKEHPVNHYQYGFVFETDNDASNDWEPIAAYPKDFFAGTDTWVQLLYAPGGGWTVSVTDVVDQQPVDRVATEARVTILHNWLFLVLPVSELADRASGLAYRNSAFLHQGNYLSDDWNADVSPPVDDGLLILP